MLWWSEKILYENEMYVKWTTIDLDTNGILSINRKLSLQALIRALKYTNKHANRYIADYLIHVMCEDGLWWIYDGIIFL
jgi:hypothetical protein